MKVEHSLTLPCPPERLLAELAKPELLRELSFPFLVFVPLDPPDWPEQWDGAQHRVALKVGARVPIGDHVLQIGAPVPGHRTLRDEGHSALIKHWDHDMVVADGPDGGTHYTDRADIRAGLLTPVAWLFAWFFYRHREKRLAALVGRDWRYAYAVDGR